MASNHGQDSSDWSDRLVRTTLYPLIKLLAPAFLVTTVGYLVISAFKRSIESGIASAAAAIIPLFIMGYAIATVTNGSGSRMENVERVALKQPPWAVVIVLGLATGAVLSLLELKPTVPIVELVFSSALALLLFAHARLRDQKYMGALCLGVVVGALGYIVLFGTPPLTT